MIRYIDDYALKAEEYNKFRMGAGKLIEELNHR